MQQTEKYKLNLIEPSDPFLPDGLNANTQKIEEVLSKNLEGMDARVTVLEAHKMALGNYIGSGYDVEQSISIGFTPRFVLSWYESGIQIAYLPEPEVWTHYICAEEGGFKVTSFANYGNRQFLAFL